MPPISFPCPRCGHAHEVDAAYVAAYGGQETTCTACGGGLVVPTGRPPARSSTTAPTPVAPAPLAYARPPGTKRDAPPTEVPATDLPPEGVWRDGTRVTVARHSRFPRRCFKCNAAADGEPLKLLLPWVPPADRLGSRWSRAAATRTVFVQPYVCADHRPVTGRFRVPARVVAVVAAACLCAGVVVGAFQRRGADNGYLIPALLVVGAVGLLVAYLLDGWTGGFNLMAASYIGDDGATVVGCGGEFVATLPRIEAAREAAARAEAVRLNQLATALAGGRPGAPAPSPLQFPCPACGKVYEVDDAYVAAYGGQQSDCDGCGRPFAIPTAVA